MHPTAAQPFPPGLCEAHAASADAYHAHINQHPPGTVLRCKKCVRLFNGPFYLNPNPNPNLNPVPFFSDEGPAVRTVIGAVIAFLIYCLIYIFVIALSAERQAKAGEADEYYAFAMRHYRYGTVTNQVWAKIHFEHATNLIEHGQIKRELVYLLEVCELEGRTNRLVLHSEFLSDTILPPR